MSKSLRALQAEGGAFQGYAYAYPHKTAYRHLDPPRPLADVWSQEDKSALFLYAHVPFCEMRCGFCNLFTMTRPGQNLVTAYLDAMSRQAEAVAEALGSSARFSRLAIGGGTPTFLSVSELERLFTILNKHFLHSSPGIPKAIEVSPATVDDDRIALLQSEGITRVSVGIQSFIDSELRALGRPQERYGTRRALDLLARARFKCFNIDLIYGIAGQTTESLVQSLDQAVGFEPHEIFIYPLYVRPLTHLDRVGSHPTDQRLDLYRTARDFLQKQRYDQVSMRLFRKRSYAPPEGPVYCCQEDGMVGLGPGARSYTRALHYSSEYAVGRTGVMDVINDFVARTPEQLAAADYGCELDLQEQKRRYVLKSLLRKEGLLYDDYFACFQSDLSADFPQLAELKAEWLVWPEKDRLKLTPEGFELSDVIGPWLWSPGVQEKMSGFALR